MNNVVGVKIRAFTLVEVLIVIIILGILATLAIPQFADIKLRAEAAGAIRMMGSLRRAQEFYHLENGTYINVDVSYDPDNANWAKLSVDNPNLQDLYFNFDFISSSSYWVMFGFSGPCWIARYKEDFDTIGQLPSDGCRYIGMDQNTGEIKGTFPH